MSVHLKTLGNLAVTNRDRVVTSLRAQPVRAALLVYIGIERETSRDAVAALLWPDRHDRQARHILSQTLYQLRRDFGESVIVARREALRANAGLLVDALDFMRAVDAGRTDAALALYQGPFLAGQRLVDTSAFETWVDLQRARLMRMHRRVRRQQIRERMEAGNAHGAVAAALAWADLDPFEDEAQHQVIAQLAATGELDEALNRYAEYARLLEKEDLSPLEETTALVERIRTQRVTASTGLDLQSAGLPGLPVSDTRPADAVEPARAAGPRGESRGRLPRLRRNVATAAMVVLAGSIGLAGLLRLGSDRSLAANRVLVVPFDNETGDATLAPVGQLAADWIVQGLARIGPLQVVPAVELLAGPGVGSGSKPRTGTGAARSAAEKAGAGLVVSGRYYKRGDTLEVYAQISDVESGKLLAALDPATSPLSLPDDAVDAVRRRVMGILAARFATDIPLELPSVSHPPTYGAFVEFRQGVELFIRGHNAAAVPHLLRATTLDSVFVRPLLLAASAYGNMGDLWHQDSLLQIVARRADGLAPYERAHLAYMRAALRGDLEAQYAAGRDVIRLAPGGPAHYVVARLSLWLGRPREALDMFRGLPPETEWMPVWWNSWTYITGAYHALGMHRRELKEIRAVLRDDSRLRMRVLELRALAALGRVDELLVRLDAAAAEPTDPALDFGAVLAQTASELKTHGHPDAARALLERAMRWYEDRQNAAARREQWRRVGILVAAGRHAAADAILAGLRVDDTSAMEYLGYRGILAARSGDHVRAIAFDDSLEAIDTPNLLGRHTYWRAAIHAHLGEVDAAMRLLGEARDQGQPIGFLLHADENLSPLWDLPEYHALIVSEK